MYKSFFLENIIGGQKPAFNGSSAQKWAPSAGKEKNQSINEESQLERRKTKLGHKLHGSRKREDMTGICCRPTTMQKGNGLGMEAMDRIKGGWQWIVGVEVLALGHWIEIRIQVDEGDSSELGIEFGSVCFADDGWLSLDCFFSYHLLSFSVSFGQIHKTELIRSGLEGKRLAFIYQRNPQIISSMKVVRQVLVSLY